MRLVVGCACTCTRHWSLKYLKTYPEYQTLVFTNYGCKFSTKRSIHSCCASLTSLLIVIFPALKTSGNVTRKRLLMAYLFQWSEISTVIWSLVLLNQTHYTTYVQVWIWSSLLRSPREWQKHLTLIDVIFTSNPAITMDSGIVETHISDHYLVFAVFNLRMPKPPAAYVVARSYKHYDPQSFLSDHNKLPWY